MKWFKDYDQNDKCSFIKYDIREFQPSITERTVEEALYLSILIPDDKIDIIKHCYKSLFYHKED